MSARRTTGPRVATSAGGGPRISAPQPATPPTLVQSGTDRMLAGAREVDVAQLAPDPDQPRKHMQPERLAELAASILKHGVLQPLVVRQDGMARDGNMRYTIVAGGRRLAAIKAALDQATDEEARQRLARVPVVVTETAAAERRVLQLIENLQREDLNPVDEARALKEVMTIENLTTTGLAARVHRSQGYIDERLRLLRHEDVEEAVETGLLTRSAGAAIASIRSADARREWIERARAGETIRPSEVYASKPDRRRTSTGVPAPARPADGAPAGVATVPPPAPPLPPPAADPPAKTVRPADSRVPAPASPAAPTVRPTDSRAPQTAGAPATTTEPSVAVSAARPEPLPQFGNAAVLRARRAALAALGVELPDVPESILGTTPDDLAAYAQWSVAEADTSHRELVERVLGTGMLLGWSCEDMLRHVRGSP
jgi:ParB/RepB/Spo0J family partition protein